MFAAVLRFRNIRLFPVILRRRIKPEGWFCFHNMNYPPPEPPLRERRGRAAYTKRATRRRGGGRRNDERPAGGRRPAIGDPMDKVISNGPQSGFTPPDLPWRSTRPRRSPPSRRQALRSLALGRCSPSSVARLRSWRLLRWRLALPSDTWFMTPLGRYSRLTPTARPLRVLGSSYQNTSLRVRYSRDYQKWPKAPQNGGSSVRTHFFRHSGQTFRSRA